MATNPFFGNFFAGNDTPYNNANTLLSVGLGLLSGKTPQEQVGNAASNFANERQAGRTYNKTIQYLQQNNPDLAQALISGAIDPASAYKLAYQQKLEAAKPKNNYITVGKNIYDAGTNQWITPPAGMGADAEEYGLNPVWGKDENGNTVLGQVSKTGKFRKLDTGGFTPTPVLQNIDTGTSVLSRNSRTGEIVADTPKNLAGAAQQTAEGKIAGETAGTAAGAIPAAKAAAQTVAQQVEELKNDSYLPNMLGPVNSRLPNMTADAARVQGKIEQLKGGAFLQARQMLKGGGAITDFEGQKAEQAYTRMSQAQSVEDFNAALDDFNAAVQRGVAILEQQAGQGTPQSSPNGNRSSTGVTWSVEP